MKSKSSSGACMSAWYCSFVPLLQDRIAYSSKLIQVKFLYIYHCWEKNKCIQLKINLLHLKNPEKANYITLIRPTFHFCCKQVCTFCGQWVTMNSSRAGQVTCSRAAICQGPKAVSLMLPNSHCNLICFITHHLQVGCLPHRADYSSMWFCLMLSDY